ncbi:MAG: hypothetical protein WCX71_04480 [Candidatus Buchananbacteria bacterium]
MTNHQAENVGFSIDIPTTGEQIIVHSNDPGFTQPGMYVREFDTSAEERQLIFTVGEDHDVSKTLTIPAGGTDSFGQQPAATPTFGLEVQLTEPDANNMRWMRVETYRNGVLHNEPFQYELTSAARQEVLGNDPRFKDGVMYIDLAPSFSPRVAVFHDRQGGDTKELHIPAEKRKPEQAHRTKVDPTKSAWQNFLRALKGE